MKKLVLVILLLLAGNLLADEEKELFSLGTFLTSIYERCYEGVVYIVYSHGITVKMNRYGQTEKCHARQR